MASGRKRTGVCFDFKRGRCRRGSNCRFSHDTTTTNASSSGHTNSQFREENEIEAICRKWTYMIPRPNTNASHFRLPPVDIKKFFEIGLNLIESEDAGIRQYIIVKVAAESGLTIIKSLTDIIDASQKDETTVAIFKDMTLPFYGIISDPDVLSSLILENPVDTIYTFLFGPSGRRGLSAFRFTATALSKIILGHPSNDDEISTNVISSSLAVLDRLIEMNQSAQVIDEFTAIVETISACISENFHGSKFLNEAHSTSSQHRLVVAPPDRTVPDYARGDLTNFQHLEFPSGISIHPDGV
jgi:hypothetical protein